MLWLINSNLDFFRKIDFCLREWSTGAFLQASFYEKNVIHTHKIYRVEVATWSEINLTVTTNIRKKLFTRAMYVIYHLKLPCYHPYFY